MYTAISPTEAMQLIHNIPIQLIVSDHRMSEMNGTDLLKEVFHFNPSIRRMILSGFIKRNELQKAVESFGIHGFVSKPWDFDDLIDL